MQAQEEMGDFLQKVHTAVVDGRHRSNIAEDRATGGCTSKNQPRAIIAAPPIEPDCKRSEGCLFCDKFRVHADEKDALKLLSAKYVVEQTSRLATSAEEYDRVFGATLKRIDQILFDMGAANPAIANDLERLAKKVAMGEMDSYWGLKMEELIEMGVL
jgi:hypothetical protein